MTAKRGRRRRVKRPSLKAPPTAGARLPLPVQKERPHGDASRYDRQRERERLRREEAED